MIKITGPHACTPTATHFGSSTHFSIPCVFTPSHFPVVPCIIHTFHTSRHPASRDQCEARDIHVCRTPSHVVVRAPARLPPRPARGADRPTPASPVAGTEQRTPHDAASPVDLQSRQVPVFTPHSHVEASASRRPVVDAGGGGCLAFASRPEGWPWNRGPPGGGQLRGGICASFPGVCHTAASGLR